MAQAFDGIASDVEQLSERVRELEQRVSALERQPTISAAPAESGNIAGSKSRPEAVHKFQAAKLSGRTLPVFGKAVLGIAGAYLFRALAEAGTLPRLLLLVVAIVYAGIWLAWAVRTHSTNGFASVTYAITAAMILSPLLWESTVRFQILQPVLAAAVLVVFVVFALVLAWHQNLQAIPWIATLTGVATALALIIATRDLVPFTAALLTVALATEVVVCLGHPFSLRAVPAIAVDFAVWLLIDLMTFPGGAPPEYRPVTATAITVLCLSLLAIYGGSIGLRTFGLRHRVTVFEIAQAAIAFVLMIFGTLRASPGSPAPLGIFFLLAAGVCYWGTLSRFTAGEQTRNRRVCASYAVALLLAGSLLLFPEAFQVPFLCLAALAAAFLYMRTGKLSLGMHVSFYLAAAAFLSGLLNLVGSALAGGVPSSLNADALLVAVSAGLCYAIPFPASAGHILEQSWKSRLLWVVPCMLLMGAGAALAVMVSVRLGSPSRVLNASRLSVVRTVVICVVALILGFTGSRGKRAELLWVAYVAIAFGTLKLVFEDLRFGSEASLVASFLFYGMILILIPRLTRLGRS